LEDESIVQSRGQQVGESVQNQNILRQEGVFIAVLNG